MAEPGGLRLRRGLSPAVLSGGLAIHTRRFLEMTLTLFPGDAIQFLSKILRAELRQPMEILAGPLRRVPENLQLVQKDLYP